VLVQEIRDFTRGTDNYQLDPDVRGDNAFLLRGVQAYYRQEGLKVCDDLNKMIFEDNPQYPNGFMPKAKTNMLSHIQSAFFSFGLVMDGTGLDGVRDGACWRFAWLCFAFRVMCSTQPVLPESLLFGHVFDITGFVCRLASWSAHEDERSEAQ
jgi:hypothetical protein